MKTLWCDVDHRDNIGNWLNGHGLTGAAVEIGCAFGGFAAIVLSKWTGETYYMVDPWTAQPKEIYRECTEGIDFEQYYRQCGELAKKDLRVKLVRKFSVDAAPDFDDQSLDFVFIDGNHAYEHVIADLDAWWPKVKPGGLMGVHDYGNETQRPHFIEVKKAVDQWCSEHHVVFTYSHCNSVWMTKL